MIKFDFSAINPYNTYSEINENLDWENDRYVDFWRQFEKEFGCKLTNNQLIMLKSMCKTYLPDESYLEIYKFLSNFLRLL